MPQPRYALLRVEEQPDRNVNARMIRRATSALACVFLLLAQMLQASLAESMPCEHDSPGVLVPILAGVGSALGDDCLGHSPVEGAPAHCTLCSSGACYMTHVPAMATVAAPILQPRAAMPPAARQCAGVPPMRFGRILRPPK